MRKVFFFSLVAACVFLVTLFESSQALQLQSKAVVQAKAELATSAEKKRKGGKRAKKRKAKKSKKVKAAKPEKQKAAKKAKPKERTAGKKTKKSKGKMGKKSAKGKKGKKGKKGVAYPVVGQPGVKPGDNPGAKPGAPPAKPGAPPAEPAAPAPAPAPKPAAKPVGASQTTSDDWLTPVVSIFNKTMEHVFPILPTPNAKYHGCKVRLVDNNDNTNDRQGKFASDSQGKMDGKDPSNNGSMMPFPTDTKSFFGGSFFSQIDSQAKQRWLQFLPRVKSMSDEAILAELGVDPGDESMLMTQVDAECQIEQQEDLVDLIREMAQVNEEVYPVL